jgi:DNA-binding GntR family transcriptional regulator
MDNNDEDGLRLVQSPVLLRQLAADTLRKAILTGNLKPGERLVEATLAKRMGVSRPSLREALTQLSAEKLVTITPNRGPAVATISWEEAQSIYEVRALLEAEAAKSFASRATPDNINSMKQSLREFQRAISKKEVDRLLRSTSEFYSVMLRFCGNPIIGEILGGLNARVSFLRARSMSQPGRSKRSLAEMTAMLDAFEDRNAAKAQQACLEHVRNAAMAAKQSFPEVPEVLETGRAKRRVKKIEISLS